MVRPPRHRRSVGLQVADHRGAALQVVVRRDPRRREQAQPRGRGANDPDVVNHVWMRVEVRVDHVVDGGQRAGGPRDVLAGGVEQVGPAVPTRGVQVERLQVGPVQAPRPRERRIVNEQAAKGVPLERRRAARPNVVELGVDPQLRHELEGARVGVLDERAVRAVAPGAVLVAVCAQKVSVQIRRVKVVPVVLVDWRVAEQVTARVGAAEHVVADEERRATLMRDAPLRVHALVVHRRHAGPGVSAPGGERADARKVPHAVALAHLARLRADGRIVDEAHVVRVGPLREHQHLDPRLRLEVALRHPREVAFTRRGDC